MEFLQAYQEMIKVHGWIGTAATLGISKKALEARAYGFNGMNMHVPTAMNLQAYSGTTYFAQAVAHASGGVFMELPSEDDTNGEALDESLLLLCEQLGKLAKTYREAKKDGVIDRKEHADLSHIANDLHATLKKSMHVMFKVYCKE